MHFSFFTKLQIPKKWRPFICITCLYGRISRNFLRSNFWTSPEVWSFPLHFLLPDRCENMWKHSFKLQVLQSFHLLKRTRKGQSISERLGCDIETYRFLINCILWLWLYNTYPTGFRSYINTKPCKPWNRCWSFSIAMQVPFASLAAECLAATSDISFRKASWSRECLISCHWHSRLKQRVPSFGT